MKSLLFIFICLSLQRFIIEEVYFNENCNNHYVGFVRFVGVCTRGSPGFSEIYKTINATSYEVSEGCDYTCSTCRATRIRNYGCRNIFSARFGVPPVIREKGFVIETFENASLCNSGGQPSHMMFHIDEVCMRQRSFMKSEGLVKGAQSGRTSWVSGLNGAEFVQFDGNDCTGRVLLRQFYPADVCSGSIGESAKVKKNFN